MGIAERRRVPQIHGMSSPDAFFARSNAKAPRRVRFHFRDGRTLEGRVFFNKRDCLNPFLSSRKRCVSVVEGAWIEHADQLLDHLIVPTATLLWAQAPDADIPLFLVPPAARPRPVEALLEGGLILTGELHLLPAQRLSDAFDGADSFIPLTGVRLQPRGQALGDVALARDAVQALREIGA